MITYEFEKKRCDIILYQARVVELLKNHYTLPEGWFYWLNHYKRVGAAYLVIYNNEYTGENEITDLEEIYKNVKEFFAQAPMAPTDIKGRFKFEPIDPEINAYKHGKGKQIKIRVRYATVKDSIDVVIMVTGNLKNIKKTKKRSINGNRIYKLTKKDKNRILGI